MCRATSIVVTSDAVLPMGTEKPTGNHPKATENTMSATRPSQKVGVAAITKQYAFTTRSTRESRLVPASTPSRNPSTPLTTHATDMRSSVLPARHASTSATGALYRREVPRSPCSAAVSHAT